MRRSKAKTYGFEELRPREAFGQEHFPGRKMSEVILEFAEPLLNGIDDESLQPAIGFAIACWNISFLPETEQHKMLNEAIDELSRDQLVTLELERMAQLLLERKRTLFAHERRMAVNYEIVKEKDSCRLLVASALTKA